MRGSRWQWFGPRRAGWYRKGSVPKKEEGTNQRNERREKREERDKHDQMKRLKDAMVRSQNGGMVQKRFGP